MSSPFTIAKRIVLYLQSSDLTDKVRSWAEQSEVVTSKIEHKKFLKEYGLSDFRFAIQTSGAAIHESTLTEATARHDGIGDFGDIQATSSVTHHVSHTAESRLEDGQIMFIFRGQTELTSSLT